MFYSSIWPNTAPLQDTKLLNLSDLDLDLSRSLNVKYDDVIGLARHGFLLTVVTCSHRLALIATQNLFSYLLSLGPNYEKSQVHRMTPMTLNAKMPKVPYICWTTTHQSQVSLWSLVFQIIEVFDFAISYNGEFEILKKSETQNFKKKKKEKKKNNVVLWGPLGGKFRPSFKLLAVICRMSSVEIVTPIGSHVNENE